MQENVAVLREGDEVDDVVALGFAAEARHPALDVGRETDARELAVVGDIDAVLELPGDHVIHVIVDRLPERGGIVIEVLLLLDQELGELAAAKKAANVAGKNALVAALHGYPPVTAALTPADQSARRLGPSQTSENDP